MQTEKQWQQQERQVPAPTAIDRSVVVVLLHGWVTVLWREGNKFFIVTFTNETRSARQAKHVSTTLFRRYCRLFESALLGRVVSAHKKPLPANADSGFATLDGCLLIA